MANAVQRLSDGIARISRSAMVMTLANTAVRSLGMLLLLPLVLAEATSADMVVWLLLANSPVYAAIADFGFLPSFTRAIAYDAAVPADTARRGDSYAGIPCARSTGSLVRTMRSIYLGLAFATIATLLVVGLVALARPLQGVDSRLAALGACAAVLIGTAATVYGNQYVAYLTGTNNIASTQRLLASVGLLGILSGAASILAGFGPFSAIVMQQAWAVAGVVGLSLLAARRFRRQNLSIPGRMDPVLLHSIWSSAWRSGLSTLVVMGSMQSGNILVAQASNAVESARYLLGMRIVQAVSQVAQAPFYSKIPQLSQLHASGAFECKLRMSQHSMRLSHWLFVIVFVAVGVVGSDLLYLVGSGVAFPSPLVWSLLGLAIMGERYGAMHIQLYSTTNHIVWHVAALRHGAAFVAIALLLWPLVGLLAVPVALLVAYWGFYVPYCTRLSYAVMGSSAAAFERTVLLPPLVLMLIYVTANLIFTYI